MFNSKVYGTFFWNSQSILSWLLVYKGLDLNVYPVEGVFKVLFPCLTGLLRGDTFALSENKATFFFSFDKFDRSRSTYPSLLNYSSTLSSSYSISKCGSQAFSS
jgi:hypothetical protein